MTPFDKIVTGSRQRTIAYTSDCLLPERIFKSAFHEIAVQSLGSNEMAGINGILFYDQHRFYQLIEGPDHAVRHLFGRIQTDPRHGQVRVLLDEESAGPSFPGIAMQAYLLDHRSVATDPDYARMKEGFRELRADNEERGRTVIDFTRSMMNAFDEYRVMW